MSNELEIIPLDSIVPNDKVSPRLRLDTDRVQEFTELYKDNPCPLPPLEVVPNDDVSTFTLTDGWHRYHALQELGQAAPCIVLPKGTDAYLHALERSAIGQKPLTRIEKQKSVV